MKVLTMPIASTFNSQRKYFQQPTQVLSTANASTFIAHRKYLRFLGHFFGKFRVILYFCGTHRRETSFFAFVYFRKSGTRNES